MEDLETPIITDETTAATSDMPAAVEEQPKRHSIFDKIKGYHPDREFASDDDYLSAAEEKMSGDDDYRSKNEEANKVIIDALYAEPVLAQVLEEVGKGASLILALSKYISPEDLDAAAKEAEPESYEQAIAMRNENRAAHQKFMDEVNANTAESQKVIEAWSAKRGIDPDAMTQFIDEVSVAVSDLYKGKITPQFLDSMYEAKTKASDIASASEEAEIRGRNANIEELTAKETAVKGDGLPGLSSMATPTPTPKPAKQKDDIEEIVDFSKRSRG